MLRKSSVWLIVLVAIVALAFLAAGCAKKQVVKEEAAAKPYVEAKKEVPHPAASEGNRRLRPRLPRRPPRRRRPSRSRSLKPLLPRPLKPSI